MKVMEVDKSVLHSSNKPVLYDIFFYMAILSSNEYFEFEIEVGDIPEEYIDLIKMSKYNIARDQFRAQDLYKVWLHVPVYGGDMAKSVNYTFWVEVTWMEVTTQNV